MSIFIWSRFRFPSDLILCSASATGLNFVYHSFTFIEIDRVPSFIIFALIRIAELLFPLTIEGSSVWQNSIEKSVEQDAFRGEERV